jgi:hypothetical protein
MAAILDEGRTKVSKQSAINHMVYSHGFSTPWVEAWENYSNQYNVIIDHIRTHDRLIIQDPSGHNKQNKIQHSHPGYREYIPI